MKFSSIAALCAVAPFTNAQVGPAARLRNRNSGVTESRQAALEEDSSREDMFWQERELEGSMSMSMSMDTSIPDPRCRDSVERTVEITALLTEISGPSIGVPGTPQSQALMFILEEGDDGRVCPDDPECGESRVINRYEMALLYFSTNGDEWSNCSANEDEPCVTDGEEGGVSIPPCLDGSGARWLSSDTECNWCGLSCNNIDDLPPGTDGCRTTDIQLENINQGGVLPQELGENIDFRTIRMENGTIDGPLPPKWGELEHLRILDLNFQELDGPIPETYYTLTKLNTLDLNDNELTGGVSELIGNIPNLQFFEVGNNDFVGPFPQSLGTLSLLSGIGMEANAFTGALPSSFASDNITRIFFQDNQLTGSIDFLDDLSVVESLVVADLSSNEFSGEIPTQLENALQMTYFNVSFNDLTGDMPTGMEDLVPPSGDLILSADCSEASGPEVVCEFCSFCT